MKRRQNYNTYLMWTSSKPKQQEVYRIPLYLPLLYKAVQKKERQESIKKITLCASNFLLKMLIGGMAGIVMAGFLVPYIANLRGYMAYGGEWIFVYLAIFAAVKMANKYFR